MLRTEAWRRRAPWSGSFSPDGPWCVVSMSVRAEAISSRARCLQGYRSRRPRKVLRLVPPKNGKCPYLGHDDREHAGCGDDVPVDAPVGTFSARAKDPSSNDSRGQSTGSGWFERLDHCPRAHGGRQPTSRRRCTFKCCEERTRTMNECNHEYHCVRDDKATPKFGRKPCNASMQRYAGTHADLYKTILLST